VREKDLEKKGSSWSGPNTTLTSFADALILRSFSAKLAQPSAVRKCFGPDQLSLFSRSFRPHEGLGTPTQSLMFFREIRIDFPNTLLVGCAYLAGQPSLQAAAFVFGDEFEMTWHLLSANTTAKPRTC